MRIRCAYSNLDIQVSHFPASLHHRECYHPIFCIPQKKLIQYTRKWADGELTHEDSYLLFLALLNSTEQVEFRVPVIQTPLTASIVANNMESLVRVISYTNAIMHPSFVLPQVAITKETCDLKNVAIWISDWHQCFVDFQDGYAIAKVQEKLRRRESTLQSFIKNVNRPIAHYAKILADWAGEAGEFPTFNITIDGKVWRICDYWKSIIQKCCKAESIFTVPSTDLGELIEHCECNIEPGSIYHHTLMELLRAGASRQQNYLGLGDLDFSVTTYRIIEQDTSIEDANKLAMIDSAPKTKPEPNEYPSKLAYLRAKLKYDMAQEYAKSHTVAAAIHQNVETITLDDGKEL